MEIDIELADNGTKGSFFVKHDGQKLAEMTFSWAGQDRIIIDHTEVSDQLRGTGVGKHMIEHAVTYAREKQIAIIPLCPFARSVFEKNENLRDVL